MPELKDRLRDAVADPDGPGCAIGVLVADGSTRIAVRGLASVEFGVPITESTRFHLASVSKQFTAYAVQLLVDRGQLSFEMAVADFLPWFKTPAWFEIPGITVDSLIHHTSGLRDQWVLAETSGRRMTDELRTADLIGLIAAQRTLNFEPGTQFRYSNSGYLLLARIVEQVSGIRFADFVRTEILQPAGMNDSLVVDDAGLVVTDRAASYETSAGKPTRRIPLSYGTDGATSLNGTVADLLSWAKYCQHLRAARERTITLTDGGEIGYGLGVRISRLGSELAVSHGGADAGYRSYFLTLPEHRLAAVVLSNDGSLDVQSLAEAIMADLHPTAAVPESPRHPPGAGSALVGQYLDDAGCAFALRELEETLTLVEGDYQLALPYDRDGWFASVAAEEFAVAAGKAAGEVRIDAGYDSALLTARRLPSDWPAPDSAALSGTFYSPETRSVMILVVRDDRLWLERSLGTAAALQPIGSRLFMSDLGGDTGTATLRFSDPGPDGRSDRLWFSTALAQRLEFARLRDLD